MKSERHPFIELYSSFHKQKGPQVVKTTGTFFYCFISHPRSLPSPPPSPSFVVVVKFPSVEHHINLNLLEPIVRFNLWTIKLPKSIR